MDGNRSFWVNVYVNGVSSSFPSRESADNAPYPKSRIAIVEFIVKNRKLEDVIYRNLEHGHCNPGHMTVVINDRERWRNYLLQKRPIHRELGDSWDKYLSECEKDG